jgi:hypothetical protein
VRGVIRFAAIVCASAGCELVFPPSGTGPPVPGDASVDGSPLAPFGPPIKIEAVSSEYEEDDPSLTGDRLELYFSSDRGSPGDHDIWVSVRVSVDQPWRTPTLVVELSTSFNEGPPEVSDDGLTMMLSSNRNGAGTRDDIYISTRASRDVAWGVPVEVTDLSTATLDINASVYGGGSSVVITHDSTGADERDLYESKRPTPISSWDIPMPLAGFAMMAIRESNGMVIPNGLVMVFDTDRPPSTGTDIWIARRPSPSDSFLELARITEVASSSSDGDPWLSEDELVLVFASSRDGNSDIYEAVRE